MNGFTIVKLPRGGYVVYLGKGGGYEQCPGPVFASAKIGEALEFIREELGRDTTAGVGL